MGVGLGPRGVPTNRGERLMWLDFADGGGSDSGGVGSELAVPVGIGGVPAFRSAAGVW